VSTPIPYADLRSLPEDKRIERIGHRVTVHGDTVGIIIENDPKKIARYKRKLHDRHAWILAAIYAHFTRHFETAADMWFVAFIATHFARRIRYESFPKK
jgi:hypothetical protein